MKKYLIILMISNIVIPIFSQNGILNVGFDIDDTILFSRDVFINIPENKRNPIDYGWVNTKDRELSIVIEPTKELIDYFTSNGHNVFFITSRQHHNGKDLAKFLSKELGFQVRINKNLFFSPKEQIGKHRFTTKHRVMEKLELDLYYGDSDSDMIAALKANVQPVRIIRHPLSVEQYGNNYFGDTSKGNSQKYPFTKENLRTFYSAYVGMFGESIYPLKWEGPSADRN